MPVAHSELGSLAGALHSELVTLDGALMWSALLFERRKDFWTKLRSEGARAQLIVTLGASALSGFKLSHEVLAMLSKFELSLSIDFCGASGAAA
jgi:hypothetical protein